MLNNTIVHYYNKFRHQGITIVGESAKQALRDAKMQVTWDKLESAGLVRLEIVPDDSPDLSFLDQKEFSKYRQKGYDRANNDGVWGIVGQYRMDEDSDWMNADSVFGFIGDDWKGSGYDTDIERNTIQSWVKAKKSRCPHCHRPM